MQTISDEFKNQLSSQNPRYIKQVFLTSRKFENGVEVYGPAADISDRVIEIAPIKWKLDNEGYSVWNTPNTVITLADTDGAFARGGALFPPGFDIYKSKITIYAGVINGAAVEKLPMFEGYILDSPVYQPEEKTVGITALGRFAVLAETDAEKISLSADDVQAVAVDARTFNTPGTALSRVTSVKKGLSFDSAGTLVENYDYTVADLNLYKKPAVINLKSDIAAGENIWLTYSQWYEDKEIDWIAAAVADAAGIEDRYIEPVEFERSVSNSFMEGGGSSFAGTCSDTEIKNNAVTLSSTFPQPVNLEWTSVEKPTGTTWTFAPDSALVAGTLTTYASAKAAQTLAYGTWEFSMDPIWDGQKCYYHFISDNGTRTTSKGYAFSIERTTTGYLYLRIYRVDSGTLKSLVQATVLFGPVVSQAYIRITRFTNGDFQMQCHPTAPLVIEWRELGVVCNDNTYTTSAYQIAVFYAYGTGNNISHIKISDKTATVYTAVSPEGDYTSPVIFGGDTFKEWGGFEAVQSLPQGCTSNFFIRVKNGEQAAFSDWQNITDGFIPDRNFRYVQLKWNGAANPDDSQNLPVLISWNLPWYTGSTTIAVVNTYGLNGQDVIQALAAFSTFETGFDRNGKFLFRARNKNTDGAENIRPRDIYKIESVSSGLDYVYNHINAELGAHKVGIDSYTLGEPSPNSIDVNGRREMTLESSAFLPPESVDMAGTLAATVYYYLYKPRRRAAVVTRFMPQLDLGDIVKINCGPSRKYPQYLDGIFATVEGLEFDLENWTTRMDLAEVI
ncbi:MAG: hypothetical protein FWF35_01395 [Elusimicrobia bacterium]|nr:hypothetical protein [Elusimicrobiota bacterium]